MNTSFAEKVVLITGGTSGIGRATAVAFAEQGANVVISGRREAEGTESLSLIQKAGGQGLFVRGDVSEESEIEALVAKTLERFGRLDFAFNNAGVGGEGRATMTATADIYNRIMDINVRGVFFSMKHQIPAILQSGGGAIVNNASVLALRPSASSPIYSASKAAVVALTKSAALEFAPKGVRINAICPAIIETDLTKQLRGDDKSRALLCLSIRLVASANPKKSLPRFSTFVRRKHPSLPVLPYRLTAVSRRKGVFSFRDRISRRRDTQVRVRRLTSKLSAQVKRLIRQAAFGGLTDGRDLRFWLAEWAGEPVALTGDVRRKSRLSPAETWMSFYRTSGGCRKAVQVRKWCS